MNGFFLFHGVIVRFCTLTNSAAERQSVMRWHDSVGGVCLEMLHIAFTGLKQSVDFISSLALPMSVAPRQIRGRALLNTTDNITRLLHPWEISHYLLTPSHPVSRWLTPPSNSHYQEHCTLITGNNKPLVSAARKYEEASAWSRGTHDSVVKKRSASLLLSALPRFSPPPLPVLPVTSGKAQWQRWRGGNRAAGKIWSSGDESEIERRFVHGGHVLQFGDAQVEEKGGLLGWSETPALSHLPPPNRSPAPEP